MELSAVLKFFHLEQSSTIADLRESYAQYEERYHPRNNRGREDWARQMMAKLDEAYDLADRYLRRREVQAFYNRVFGETVDEQSKRYAFFNAFHEAVDQTLQGIYTYYQFGLENVHLRHEGSRGMKYRLAIRNVEESLRRLKEIHQYAAGPADKLNTETFFNFALAFHENMQIDRRDRPTGSSAEAKAYKHYHQGSIMLDDAIKEVFFVEFQRGPRTASTSDRLALCTNEFIVVIAEFTHTSWITQTVIKVHLIDVMTKLLERS